MSAQLPLSRRNGFFFALGLACIALGYLFLRLPPADGLLSLTVAPLLLVIGYCLFIPLALLVGLRGPEPSRAPGPPA
jgi:hypothetical protein